MTPPMTPPAMAPVSGDTSFGFLVSEVFELEGKIVGAESSVTVTKTVRSPSSEVIVCMLASEVDVRGGC